MSKVGHVHLYRNCWVQGPLSGAPAVMKRLSKVNTLPEEVKTAADKVQGKKAITPKSKVLWSKGNRHYGLYEGFKTEIASSVSKESYMDLMVFTQTRKIRALGFEVQV